MRKKKSTGAQERGRNSKRVGSDVAARQRFDREFVGPPISPQVMRSMLARQLRMAGDGDLAAILDRCEEPLHLTCTCCGTPKIVEQGCKKRWCPVCGPKLSAEKVARFRYAWERMQWPLMVVLTVRSRAYAEESIRWLVGRFFDFRRGKWWKSCDVKGGIRGLEITWSDKGWHPHLHLLMDCRWLAYSAREPGRGASKTMIKAACEAAQHELAVKWAAHCGQENSMVWVKRTAQDGIKEVVKYTVKHSELLELGSKAGEVIRAMRHTRATQAWGSCYGIAGELRKLEEADKPAAKCDGCERPAWVPSALIIKDFGQAFEAAQAARVAEVHRAAETNKTNAKKRKDAEKFRPEAEEMARYERAMKAKTGARVTVSYVRGAAKA